VIIMSGMHPAMLLVVPALIACASPAGRQPADGSARTADTLIMVRSNARGSMIILDLDSARVDSLRLAGIIIERNVDERPQVLFGPQLAYPERARENCITGRVIIQAIVGRDGRAELTSIRVKQRVDPDLDWAAMDYVRKASFKPGKVHGQAVRTLVHLPIDFKIRTGRRC
jgi:TonB family protein